MGRFASTVLGALCMCASYFPASLPAVAEDSATVPVSEARERLGFGNLLVNDALGDGYDRWRSGSYSTSRVWGRGWDGALPEEFGDILELRIGGEIISPANLVTPAPGDRRWAGSLFVGLHTHFQRGGTEFALGGDLVAIGPMTRLDQLQGALHDLVGIDGPSDAVRAAQIGDQIIPRFVGEIGRDLKVGERGTLRPFMELRAGDETLARAGFDVTIGQFGQGELLVRDWVTGHRYRTIRNHQKSVSFVAGADIAKVFDSVYLPSSDGYQLSDERSRVRAGIHVRGEAYHVFYGVSWLSKEFKGQSDDQLVGAIKLDFNF
ncbi:lipid A-modifier LpxR family protein [Shimia sp. Alg240-R146]|uniref:lipid A-modifier LpxR family protein n=1 Tax=Shimia sp. Alg240-R146 TaxID=2993449 RepID=UPI0022DF884F|nr:lipid A-modifier LpxR family protein [Shimia sp. Alg240-R146]